MKTKYTFALLSGLLMLSSCEEGFNFLSDSGAGSFNKHSLLLDVRDDAETVAHAPSRAGSELDDFKIIFYKNNSSTPEASYIYSEMPDVIVLPVGLYSVTATKGVDVEADWESPYFLGQSNAFQIKKDSITSDIDPIICRLQNVKVSVEFDPVLTDAMSPDSYVEVKVGDNAGLRFDKSKEGVAGHFKHTDGVSLVATFNGVVEGATTSETKSFDQVLKGHHYKIRFKLHTQDSEHVGGAAADINVDASVTVRDLEYDIDVIEDEDLGDDERPKEDLGGGEDPENPSVSDFFAPLFSVVTPQTLEFDKSYNVTADDIKSGIKLLIKGNPGFKAFTVDIISPNLTPEELTNSGLSDHLDLVNTAPEIADPLGGFGFPVNIGGFTEVEFSITNMLMNMLYAVGRGNEHTFRLTVTNHYQAEGESEASDHTVVKDLILKF